MTGKQKVHLIGIGGSGMISLANLLLESNFLVSGSDIVENEKLRMRVFSTTVSS